MSDKYCIKDQGKPYFLTLTVIGWIDLFTRETYKYIIIDSLSYCQKVKGLEIFAYCLMPSHLHLIARSQGICSLSDIIRDFKKFTTKTLIHKIQNEAESRREWLLSYFINEKNNDSAIQHYKIWKNGYHGEEISSNAFFDIKLQYIHNNPVKELIVENPEDYMFSSARNYAGLNSFLDIILESVKQEKYRK